jgi:hypothetical protein
MNFKISAWTVVKVYLTWKIADALNHAIGVEFRDDIQNFFNKLNGESK